MEVSPFSSNGCKGVVELMGAAAQTPAGTVLLQAAEDELRTRHVPIVFLKTLPIASLQTWYEQHGYTGVYGLDIPSVDTTLWTMYKILRVQK